MLTDGQLLQGIRNNCFGVIQWGDLPNHSLTAITWLKGVLTFYLGILVPNGVFLDITLVTISQTFL